MRGEETPGRVSKSFEKQRPPTNIFKEATIMAVKEKIRIRLKGYDHQLVDQSAERIVQQLSAQAQEFQVPFRSRLRSRL